jgi:uncharacterized protein (TIGR03435 family)
MTQLAKVVSRNLDRAVIDQTELKAASDVDVSWMPDEMDRNQVGAAKVNWMKLTVSLLIVAVGAFGQEGAAPTFEAASVKVSVPLQGGTINLSMRGGPGSSDPGRIDYHGVTLKTLAARAYGVKEYQVEGAEWLNNERYDIVATMREGATKDQLALMLQGLLAERFKLAVHHETKVLPVYALSVGKGGPKLKEVDPAAASVALAGRGGPFGPGAPPPPPPPPGATGKPVPAGMTRMMIGMNNRRLEGSMTVQRLCDNLSNWLDRPVLDQTELKGTYAFDLSWTPDQNDRVAGQLAAAIAVAGQAPPPPGAAPDNASDPGLSLAQALQANYGLKLEARKNPADVIAIDRAEKVPTEN